jgi:hypothetical protein
MALFALAISACSFNGAVPLAGSGASQDGGEQDSNGLSASGRALSFDGVDDYVQFDRTIAEDFTLEAWIQTTASQGGTRFFNGLGLIYADVSGSGSDFGTSILNDHFCFGSGFADETVESTTVVTTGEWIHVAAVRTMSDGVLRVIVNGVQEGAINSNNFQPVDASPTIHIGGNTIDSRYFEGAIDEVRVWDKARSAEEILATMNSRLSGEEANLVGYWNFDNDSELALDASATLNHGSPGGGDETKAPGHIQSGVPLD